MCMDHPDLPVSEVQGRWAQQAKLEWLIEEVTSMAAGSRSGDDAAEEIRAATAADGGDDEGKE